MRVLLVEDDLTAARGIALMLRSGGAVVDHADTGEEALELVRHYDYDIMVLDLMLPDMEGYEVVRRMRAARIEVPVLILSGLTRPQAKVKGLALGADDFLTKPFDKAELIARMQAVVRRSKGFSQPALRVGSLQLNLDSREVTVDGAAGAPDRQGIRDPGTAGAAQGHGPDQGGVPEPPLRRHGRTGDEDHRRVHLQAAQEAGAGRRRQPDRHGLGPRLHDPRALRARRAAAAAGRATAACSRLHRRRLPPGTPEFDYERAYNVA